MMVEVKKTRSELKRSAILQGAIQAFKQYGVSDTSMDKIAEVAQVSKRTVYNHFESKELLVTHIIKEIWCKNVVSYEVKYNPDITLKEQLIELVENELSLSKQPETIELIRVALTHSINNPEMFNQELHQFFEQDTALVRWLKAAIADNRFKTMDPHKANEQIVSLLKGQAFWPQIIRFDPLLNDEEQSDLANETVDMFLAYYQR
ncbi:TetR/AcrR family transcriptional regulator C-terminal domain-containing protein [Thalassotalea profundi]|uniref:Transcriptional regulator n=1 Tax=Thalassotalea profundi TaxID=2036687 RepID=A0ABQ3IS39_9GAMM|nr:TetR/AcrR family transcriptional regulator C-terminal domain-containing protein [Thalassotalea profundi]GHE87656.1 transcriptional regulator [Thalassotalea profundi]